MNGALSVVFCRQNSLDLGPKRDERGAVAVARPVDRHVDCAGDPPGSLAIINTRSLRINASSMSWVTSSAVTPSRCTTRYNSACIRARVKLSRAAEGFIEKQQLRKIDQCPSQRNALSHPSRQLFRPASSAFERPTSESKSLTRVRWVLRFPAKATLSSTAIHGKRRGS